MEVYHQKMEVYRGLPSKMVIELSKCIQILELKYQDEGFNHGISPEIGIFT